MQKQAHPYISICIPAYKRTHYLKRLLQSIAVQTFKDFEVILSDDSDDDSVEQIAKEYEEKLPIRYYRNKPSLGTPGNWNFAIDQATGDWIKIMHDDDWLATPVALQTFAEATRKGSKFIVSGYDNIDDNGKKTNKPRLSSFRRQLITRMPMVLLSENYIGQPSATMVHRSVTARYDERMKWRVDIDYYMQLLIAEKRFLFIPDQLVHIGINAMQVTNSCLNVPGVELPEGWLLLNKYGTGSLQNILVYDAWWRIIRNTGTRSIETLYKYASSWPKAIEAMTLAQSRIQLKYLRNGILSKLYMFMQYLRFRKQ